MKRITVDLTKASTETLDLTSALNPRVGDGQLSVPLHIIYGTDDSGNDDPVDMRDKDIEFLSQDTNKNDIYVSGTVTTNSKGDDPYNGNVTFVFPEGTFKVAGTYDVDKTMFRIINQADKAVLSTVNVKLNVLEGGSSDYNFDPNKTSYNSRLEDMIKLAQSQMKDKINNADKEAQTALTDAKQKAADIIKNASDQAQSLLDGIKQTSDEAKGNVAGDTAATAKQAKQLANDNAGKVHDLQDEVGDARGRFMTLSDRENKQDFNIDRKEDKVNANANYAAINLRDDQQDAVIADKAGRFELENKLSQIDLQPEVLENEAALKAKYPNGKVGLIVTADTWHKYVWTNNSWQDCGELTYNAFDIAREASQNVMYGQDITKWTHTTEGTITQTTGYFAEFENQNIMHASSNDASQYVRIVSPVVPIDYNVISIQFPEMAKNLSNLQGAYIEVQQFAPGDDPDNDTTGWGKNDNRFIFSDNDMTLAKFNNIRLNSSTTRIRVQYVLHDTTGDIYVGTPVVNYGDVCIPYSPLSGEKAAEKAENYREKQSLDLLYGSGLSSMSPLHGLNNATVTTVHRDQFPGIDLIDFVNSSDGWNVYQTMPIEVEAGSTISVQIPGRVVSGDALVSVKQFKDYWGIEEVTENFFKQSNRLSLNKFQNVKLDPSTNYAVIAVSLNGKGEQIFGMPKVNYGDRCIPYNAFDKGSDNLLEYSGFSYDDSMGIFTLNAEDAQVVAFDTINHHNKFPNLDFWRVPLSDTQISFQVPYQSSGSLWAQFRYSTNMDDNWQTTLTYGLSASKDRRIAKFEGIDLPEGTKSVAVRIWPADNAQGKIWLPKINYGSSCMPYEKYSQSEVAPVTTDSQAQSIARLYIAGGSQGYNKLVPFKYISNSENVSGYINYDVQGNSSRNYEKKNFKIKLFKDADSKEKLKVKILQSWKKNNKYNLKANWIDATQARNIVNARLFKDAVAITPLTKPDQVAILDTPDLGQMNGIPVELYFNNEFYGLYTFNTKKDDVTFAMDAKNDQHEVVSVCVSHDAFSDASATVDGTHYATEIHDTASDGINTGFTKLMGFINSSTDEDFKAHIGDYIDVKSVINELLFGTFSSELDFYAKSILLATWNGGSYWYMIPYDLDSTWGLDWNGSKIKPLDDPFFNLSLALKGDSKANAIGKFENGNKLLSRIYQLFKPEIKAQGQKLRASVWSTQAIIDKFRKFIDSVPVDSYKKEQAKWTTLPSVDITSFNQIQSYVIKRGQDFDSFLSQLA